MGYENLPDGYDFNSGFDTYILAFCPDTDTWFATNQRSFYYEYPMDFPNEEIAIEYFKKNPEIFWKIEQDIMKGHSSDGVYLENISTLIPMSDSKTEPKPKRSIENHEDDINR